MSILEQKVAEREPLQWKEEKERTRECVELQEEEDVYDFVTSKTKPMPAEWRGCCECEEQSGKPRGHVRHLQLF